MKIGIQARELSGIGGTKTYVENILHKLVYFSDHQLYIFHNSKNSKSSDSCAQYIYYNMRNPVVSDHIILPYLIRKYNIDLAWFPKNVLPLFYSTKNVVTIHGLVYFIDKHYHPTLDTIYMKRMIKRSCQKADKVITISQNTKKDILNFVGCKEDKISVVYHGVDDMFCKDKDKDIINDLKTRYGLNRRIIYGGNLGLRKNSSRLIEAFNKISNKQYQLVFTGKIPNDKVRTQIERNPNVKSLGYVSKEHLLNLYHLADLFVYPSLYEGFGLPPLEAMACGTPVITSNTSSLPEVVGDAGITVNPFDVDGLAVTMLEVLQSDSLQKKMVKRGFGRARCFTWDRTAKETLRVLESVLDEN